MDAIDNPDHGASTFNGDGIKVVTRPFAQSKVTYPSTPAPAGGPNFPAIEDAEINPVPS